MSDPNFQGNVGTRLLKRFVVTFDYGHQIMYLKRLPAPVADIGTFDRSGMWINASPKGFTIVDVTPGGAAEAAGLKVGDEITAVDGAPAGGVGLSDLRGRLRDATVRSVTLRVESGGQARTLELTLKDLV
jgi:S1-C subfamily serine protease